MHCIVPSDFHVLHEHAFHRLPANCRACRTTSRRRGQTPSAHPNRTHSTSAPFSLLRSSFVKETTIARLQYDHLCSPRDEVEEEGPSANEISSRGSPCPASEEPRIRPRRHGVCATPCMWWGIKASSIDNEQRPIRILASRTLLVLTQTPKAPSAIPEVSLRSL